MRNRHLLYMAINFVLVFASSTLLAQSKNSYGQSNSEQNGRLDVHAGYLAPKDTDTGMLFGAAYSSPFDEAIDLGFGLDIFQKTYANEVEVSDPNSEPGDPKLVLTKIDYKTTAIPLYVSMRVKIPGLGIISKQSNKTIFGYFVRASLSYQFIISDINNYEKEISEKRNFKGWGWQGGAGMYYRVGSRSTLVAEAIYNNCITNSKVSKEVDGLPEKKRIDLSGVGLRVGVELEL